MCTEESHFDSMSHNYYSLAMIPMFISAQVSEVRLMFLIHILYLCSQERVQMSENAINYAREGYRSVAKRGAVCFDVARCMTEINALYQTSWQQFLDVYDSSIKHSER